jgi:arabinose-5-phosphate isomerase
VSAPDRVEDPAALLEEGRRVLRLEAAAVEALAGRLDGSFVEAARLLAETPGRVVVSGIGKSGLVARKIAATLTSTGTPASFLHPVEALHGDLGIVAADDVALLVSKSGRTEDALEGLCDQLVRLGVPIVALTSAPGSDLARCARVVLDCSVAQEACPLDLTPTASAAAAAAMGDALAVAVFRRKGFRAEDFRAFHPGGSLGRKLTLRVEDVMVAEGYPSLAENAVMRETVAPIAEMRGTVPIVDAGRRVVGVVTAGDLTRLMEKDPAWPDRSVSGVMTRSPRVAHMGELAAAAVRRMEQGPGGVMALPVVDEEGILRGILHLHDLLRSGAV